ncbi:hypothetical protein TIFTF001_042984 [Ficus carica]|uniref:Uncharacterized protein n=1 Tax=Ficus carica TaxID=3494 RepID=A0AA87YPK7_FICCA|nr:hypothetical protein TIFTF001_042972 [Ficus carica]GMN20038.1 hypothetical protein TIFTF001_042975 [Ficus carica]GMN20049.1 hypothetical protein TIFTF001_042981 [Ficus carica]GMN20057.1 hypothetical protein TIFTF001_042984 [Ficus carica]
MIYKINILDGTYWILDGKFTISNCVEQNQYFGRKILKSVPYPSNLPACRAWVRAEGGWHERRGRGRRSGDVSGVRAGSQSGRGRGLGGGVGRREWAKSGNLGAVWAALAMRERWKNGGRGRGGRKRREINWAEGVLREKLGGRSVDKVFVDFE